MTDATTVQAWLEGRVVAYGKVDAGSFTPDTPLAELGLDSVYALTLCGDIEDEFGLEVDPTIVWDHPTSRDLAQGSSRADAGAAAAIGARGEPPIWLRTNDVADAKRTVPVSARTAQSCRPAPERSADSSPTSLSPNGARMTASASEPIVRPNASASAAKPGE